MLVRSLINNSFIVERHFLALRSCSRAFRDTEMYTLAASSSGVKKLRRYVLRERRTSFKYATRWRLNGKRGLSQLDHQEEGSNCHRRPAGNREPKDGVIARGRSDLTIT